MVGEYEIDELSWLRIDGEKRSENELYDVFRQHFLLRERRLVLFYPSIFRSSGYRDEFSLRHAAYRTSPVLRNILEPGSRSDSGVGIPDSLVIDIAARNTEPSGSFCLLRTPYPFRFLSGFPGRIGSSEIGKGPSRYQKHREGHIETVEPSSEGDMDKGKEKEGVRERLDTLPTLSSELLNGKRIRDRPKKEHDRSRNRS